MVEDKSEIGEFGGWFMEQPFEFIRFLLSQLYRPDVAVDKHSAFNRFPDIDAECRRGVE